ncbi:hypothetical protein F5880DRAFT_192580 [Lentinula raphanica]|nr:hypothetical protein F5880DRAFT_192580 [Lentinula raphanica]
MSSTVVQPKPAIHQGIAVMLLFDNNQLTKTIWSDLRDHYLPAFFNRLRTVHRSATITIFVQECGSNGNMNELLPFLPRRYINIQDVTRDMHFDATQTRRLTGPLIHEAIEFLSATAATARHIAVIGPSLRQKECSTIEWHRLAQSLAQLSIYCHLMLHAHAASHTEPLHMMFDETLRLQRLTEDKSWFTDNKSQITLRMSSVRILAPPPEVVSPLKASSSLVSPRQSLSPAPLIHNFPNVSSQAMHMPTFPTPAPDEELPSIVTQLQQMHGLTKKKVYGTKPKRLPFISSEVYGRESSRKAASLSPVSPSDTNHGGRVTSPSLIDRSYRVHQSGPGLPHPNIARSSLDITSSNQTSPGLEYTTPSYRPPTMTMSLPSSPVLVGPSLFSDPAMVTSRTGYHQAQPQISVLSPSRPQPMSQPARFIAEDIPAKTHSQPEYDGGASNSLPTHGEPLYPKNQNQDVSINATPSYPVSRSLYRDELLSHLGGPSVGSTASDQHFPYGPSSELTSYVQQNQGVDSFAPLRQPTPWRAPYDPSPDFTPNHNHHHTISQYGMTAEPLHISSYPSSPVSSTSSSLTGWAG